MKQQEIVDWLKSELAKKAQISPGEVDIQEPFASYGLDSLAAVELSVQLEEMLHIKFSPTLYWDYPNIADLAKYLSTQKPG